MREINQGSVALRHGRVSLPGAEYFLTICTEGRRQGMTTPAFASALLAEASAMDRDGTWQLRSLVIMPDHLHLLVVLGERLSLGKAVARLKSKTKGALAEHAAGIEWQRDFYDHHVRPGEERLPIFHYVYFNPWRAGLCARDERWPWYHCRAEDWRWLEASLAEARPLPNWLESR